ncbi:MAG: 30S ribosomal protein S20 [Bacilli bacterium]|nr:30S ribosomal protein S20 [Bacilli bacterium]
MPNIKSSKKAVKVIAKKTENNHEPKAKVKNLIKDVEKALVAGETEKANTLFKSFQKACDDAVSKGLIKKNTADRQKSRLAQKIKNVK